MGAVLQFRPGDDDLAEAWAAYDAAQQEALRIHSDPASTVQERFKSSVAAIGMHRRFYRLCVRAGVGG